MSVGEVAAVAAAVLVAVLTGVLVATLVALAHALRDLRATLDDFARDADEAVSELRATVRHAGTEVDRVDRLVTAAEAIEGRVDAASRLAHRTFTSPVVKAMALGTGVQRASQRLRGGRGDR